MIPLDRGRDVRSFDEMINIDLGGVDIDDPTINVRGHCALAIATATPGKFTTAPKHNRPNQLRSIPACNRRTSKNNELAI